MKASGIERQGDIFSLCSVIGHGSSIYIHKKVFGRYEVSYHTCLRCGWFKRMSTNLLEKEKK